MTRLLFTLILAAGCSSRSDAESSGESDEESSAVTTPARRAAVSDAPSAADTAEATKVFQTRCTACHGAEGRGDGATAKGLTPPPRDLTNAAWQSQVDDPYIERIIAMGGMAVGKSAAMPPNPDLASKTGVIKALRAHVRGLRH